MSALYAAVVIQLAILLGSVAGLSCLVLAGIDEWYEKRRCLSVGIFLFVIWIAIVMAMQCGPMLDSLVAKS